MRRTPAEWERHSGTLVAWPTRDAVWAAVHALAEAEYAALISAIARYEPVTVVCRSSDVQVVRAQCGNSVGVIVHEIDDGWIRDSGPILVFEDGAPRFVDFDFNSWGNRYMPYDGDQKVGAAIAHEFGITREAIPFVLEGGAITWNGAGTALAVRECVMHPSRNGDATEKDVERLLAHTLGIERLIWLPFGLLEDLQNTDGHVDNVAVFVSPNVVLAQSCDAANPNHPRLAENAAVLRASRVASGDPIEVVTCDVLPYASMPDGSLQPAPYVNFCLTNGSVVLPTVGAPGDEVIAPLIAQCFPHRSVEFALSRAMTYGGGGPHCITMQLPAPPT
jgi:agmatine deiminase